MHYFSVSEYARFAKKSRPTVYKRVESGELDSYRTEEGQIIIKVEDTEYAKVKGN